MKNTLVRIIAEQTEILFLNLKNQVEGAELEVMTKWECGTIRDKSMFIDVQRA